MSATSIHVVAIARFPFLMDGCDSWGSQRVGHDWATELNWTELNQQLIGVITALHTCHIFFFYLSNEYNKVSCCFNLFCLFTSSIFYPVFISLILFYIILFNKRCLLVSFSHLCIEVSCCFSPIDWCAVMCMHVTIHILGIKYFFN